MVGASSHEIRVEFESTPTSSILCVICNWLYILNEVVIYVSAYYLEIDQ